MTAQVRFRDAIRSMVPEWLSDRDQGTGNGLFKAFGVLFTLAAAADNGIDTMIQGIRAAWPGNGTPTALPYIGRNRGIIRGEADTDEDYAARLIPWLSTRRGDLPDGGGDGSQLAVAKAFHEYLGNHPRVRVVNRHGYWTTVNADGSIDRVNGVPFDWDSVTNPENATHWRDQWVIVYTPEWARDTAWGTDEDWGGPLGFGMAVDRQAVDALVGQLRQLKRASTYIRAVIWSYDPTLFDPAVPASLPDGTWGTWHVMSGGVAVPSGRNVVDCRYWEGII